MDGVGDRPFIMETIQDTLIMTKNNVEQNNQNIQPEEHLIQVNKSGSCSIANEDEPLVLPEATKKGYVEIESGECFDGTYLSSKTRRGRRMSKKSNCLMAANQNLCRYEGVRKIKQLNPVKEFGSSPRNYNRVYDIDGLMSCLGHEHGSYEKRIYITHRIRRLTPTECARLQTIPEWYEWKGKFPDGSIKKTSDTQIYKMCGNGWNVEVIKHIFSYIDVDKILNNKTKEIKVNDKV